MRNVDAQPIIRTLLGHHAESRAWRTEPSSFPAADYTDPEVLEREQELLRRGPILAALSADLPEPSYDLGPRPLMVV